MTSLISNESTYSKIHSLWAYCILLSVNVYRIESHYIIMCLLTSEEVLVVKSRKTQQCLGTHEDTHGWTSTPSKPVIRNFYWGVLCIKCGTF